MQRAFTLATVVVLFLFAAAVAGVIGYQLLYVWPQQRCDKANLWWDPKDRQCLTPIPIRRLTSQALAGYKITPASPLGPKAAPPPPARSRPGP
jgi:hypothetical protein